MTPGKNFCLLLHMFFLHIRTSESINPFVLGFLFFIGHDGCDEQAHWTIISIDLHVHLAAAVASNS